MDKIHIISSSNDNYAIHLCVMLNSLLMNKSAHSKIHIWIIDGDISPENKNNIKKVVQKYNTELTYLSVDHKLLDGLEGKQYKSKDDYYKLYTPQLLNKNIRKALYLDCDLIVEDDITKLWNNDIDRYYLAAVIQPTTESRKRKLRLPEDSVLFNTGVMLLNLDKWRKNRISDKILQFIRNNSAILTTLEQEAQNVILHKKWLQLNPKWNYSTKLLKVMPHLKPSIIHYTGSKKPWNVGHPLQAYYFKYLKSIPRD
ncbi:glycosyltransferase family 8 protein [Paenibacillus sedimenti]|uniref:Glycosyltransferase family 8 protein n=1 Tax=Paenibacillus sedimenti TaxID=2770274 RepID=A0A926KPL8_9BACL|nr:glycosyltransferase family 8 protein [Paenibacillus sedimenti]MBD0381570.1 glycosyltransferase family 8 protein [Paenibacillus sedimenti]